MIYIKTKKREALASLLMIMALGQPALAQNDNEVDSNSSMQWYGGLAFSGVNVTCKSSCEDITFGITAKVGYDFNEYIGVEGRFVKTFMEYEQSKVEHYGVFAKPMYPVTDKLNVYGLIGYAQTNDVGETKSYNGAGLSWGLGLNYLFENVQETLKPLSAHDENKFGVFLEYQSLIEGSAGTDINGVNLGFLYRF